MARPRRGKAVQRKLKKRPGGRPGGQGSQGQTEDGEGIGPPPPVPGEPPPGPEGGPPPGEDHGIPGLPPDVADRLDQIIRQYGGGESAIRRAMQWLMTTAWFKQEYAGFDVGFAKGQFSDVMNGGLAQYRQYKNEINRQWRQYYGRDVTTNEVVDFINRGYDVGRTESIGKGYVNVQANRGEWDYVTGAYGGGGLNEEEEKAYGEQLEGIDSELGKRIQDRVAASIARMQRVFQGTVGSSVLGDQALARRQQQRPDIQA